MLSIKQSVALSETIQSFGFGTIEDYALDKAKQEIYDEMRICSMRISALSQKYGMDYANFCRKFHQLPQDLFEKEEDSSDWGIEIMQLCLLLERLSKLNGWEKA